MGRLPWGGRPGIAHTRKRPETQKHRKTKNGLPSPSLFCFLLSSHPSFVSTIRHFHTSLGAGPAPTGSLRSLPCLLNRQAKNQAAPQVGGAVCHLNPVLGDQRGLTKKKSPPARKFGRGGAPCLNGGGGQPGQRTQSDPFAKKVRGRFLTLRIRPREDLSVCYGLVCSIAGTRDPGMRSSSGGMPRGGKLGRKKPCATPGRKT